MINYQPFNIDKRYNCQHNGNRVILSMQRVCVITSVYCYHKAQLVQSETLN